MELTKEELLEEIAGVKKAKDSIKMAMDIDYPPGGTTTDFEVISGDSKKGKEIAEKLGITARPGYPIKESGKADLKVVKPVTKTGFTDPFPGKKSVLPSKEPLNIRLMKNFDQELNGRRLG